MVKIYHNVKKKFLSLLLPLKMQSQYRASHFIWTKKIQEKPY